MTAPLHLWLRAETKPNEQRTALTPDAAKVLMEHGIQVTLEASEVSAYKPSEYPSGVTLVPSGSWVTEAPKDAFIYGLKELPDSTDPLVHRHIMFGHCFKGQDGWADMLKRFDDGNGTLFDLEFLQDANGRRVAAFGYYAGFAGAAIGIDVWCHKVLSGNATTYPSVQPFKTVEDLVAYLSDRLTKAVEARGGSFPEIMVMGALGRCGSGAVDLSKRVGIPDDKILKWDMKETAKGGPFKEIVEYDIFVNCIYLSTPIPPFLTLESLNVPSRKLNVLVDVSCDPNNPHNPIPVYNTLTTFVKPTLRVQPPGAGEPLDIIAIDHLPTLLPREASDRFCSDLLPTLLQLKDVESARVWTDAEKLFKTKVAEMKELH